MNCANWITEPLQVSRACCLIVIVASVWYYANVRNVPSFLHVAWTWIRSRLNMSTVPPSIHLKDEQKACDSSAQNFQPLSSAVSHVIAAVLFLSVRWRASEAQPILLCLILSCLCYSGIWLRIFAPEGTSSVLERETCQRDTSAARRGLNESGSTSAGRWGGVGLLNHMTNCQLGWKMGRWWRWLLSMLVPLPSVTASKAY